MKVDQLYGYQPAINAGRYSPQISNRDSRFQQTLRSTAMKCPESMDVIFEEAAQKYDLPVNLLKAVAKAESDFNPNATSPKGAAGVMQLMPATARGLGVSDPYDARSNIMGGAKYLKEMLGEHGGNVELALAAYNAGSNNVKKYGGIPPFTETQNYVKKIMGYLGQDLTAGRVVMTGGPGTEYAPIGSAMYAGLAGESDPFKLTIGGEDYYVTSVENPYAQSLGLDGALADDENGFLSLLTGNLDAENCQYLVELLRLRMQSALMGASALDFSDTSLL